MSVLTNNGLTRYCGFVLVLALIFGGGTSQGLWSDHLLQIILLPAVFYALAKLDIRQMGWLQILLSVAMLGFLAIQFIPSLHKYPENLGLEPMLGLFSNAPQKALNRALFVLTIYPFFLLVQRLSANQQQALLGYILFGLLINLTTSILQLSASQTLILATPLPFDILGGLFANPNHFSSLIYIAIPPLAWLLLWERERGGLYLGATTVLALFSFAVGSAAAMVLTVGLAIVSFLMLAKKFSLSPLIRAALLLGILVGGAALIYLRDPEALQSSGRVEIFQATWLAIIAHWPQGSGLGSFVEVYPLFEPTANIVAQYTNHAHNDFLELLLEGGVFMAIILVLYGVILAKSIHVRGLKQAALLAIIALLAHSVVDYPLRTMAIALIFATLNGILLRRHD